MLTFNTEPREPPEAISGEVRSPLRASPDRATDTGPSELSLLLAEMEAALVVRSINAWAESDVPIQPAWSARTSHRTLPSDADGLAALIDESHAKLVRELAVGGVLLETTVQRFDPTEFCRYTVYGQLRDTHPDSIKTMQLVREHFADLTVDVASGRGHFRGPYPFEFDWYVVLEPGTGVIYSFIFNLQD